YIGTPNQIAHITMNNRLIEAIVASAVILFGVIFICIYVYRRRALHPLYFGLHCLTGALYILSHGEKLLMELLPGLDYLMFARLQYLSPAFNILAYLLFLHSFYPELFRGKLFKTLVALALGMIPVGFILPLTVQSVISGYQMVFIVTVILYSVYMLVLGIVRGMRNAVFVGISAVITLFIALLSIGNVLGNVMLDVGYMIAVLLFSLNQMLLLAVRVGDTFNAVEELNEQLAQQDHRKDEFLAMTSHEFRTPLHGIMNIISLYMEKEGRFLSDDDLHTMRLVVDITKRLSRLVNDLLDVDRIRSGRFRLEKTCFSLRQCLGDVVNVCRSVFAGTNTAIQFVSHDELPDVWMDRDRLIQIVYSLIENAVAHARAAQVELRAEYQNGQTTILISDTGGGIPPEQLGKIFDLYESFDPAAQGGGGIGLSIVKQLTEYMGGTVGVESQIGKGTVFTLCFADTACNTPARSAAGQPQRSVWLPTPEENLEAEIQTPYILRQTGSSTILIADDNAFNLRVTLDALQADGHTIIAVKNGAEMLKAVANYPQIDLVILDLLLPDSSGYDLCIRLRERKSIVELPVLILTAAVSPGDLRHALSVGANDFLYKPYPVGELRARVHIRRNEQRRDQHQWAGACGRRCGRYGPPVARSEIRGKERRDFKADHLDILHGDRRYQLFPVDGRRSGNVRRHIAPDADPERVHRRRQGIRQNGCGARRHRLCRQPGLRGCAELHVYCAVYR
ncbi:MAG: response regulator, partial [Firmicutes bacterium]|nr:response regulator [Bacillota bacterium]